MQFPAATGLPPGDSDPPVGPLAAGELEGAAALHAPRMLAIAKATTYRLMATEVDLGRIDSSCSRTVGADRRMRGTSIGDSW
jgi:hypothetical protein